MSYSVQRATSDGTLSLIDISIKYLFRDEISVLFDGVVDALPWAWVGAEEKKISFSPAVPNGVEVTIKRTTDISNPLHVLTQGAQFTNRSMDENFTQILHIAQEAKEGSGLGEVYQDLNFHGYKAVNVGDGSADMDAVNHRQMQVHDATIIGYRDAAAASADEAEYWAGVAEAAADLSALLRKDDNLASLTDKPVARANLGLGSAATATLGTGSGQVPTADQVPSLVPTVQASESTAGVIELATAVEAKTGDTTRAITGATLKEAQIQLGSAVAASGTAVDFTGIPSFAKRVTILLSGVSTSGASIPIIQLGDSGGIENSGYLGSGTVASAGASSSNQTIGFGLINSHSAAILLHGVVTLARVTGNTWVCSGVVGLSGIAGVGIFGGSKTLSDILTQVRLTTVNGTDTFDAGNVNISWE